MTKQRALAAIMILLFSPALFAAPTQRAQVLQRGPDGTPSFVKGDFGALKGLGQASDATLRGSAQSVLQALLAGQFGASGKEKVVPGKVYTDPRGGVHLRFSQQINGLPVAGAGMVLHARADGAVFAVNGEFVKGEGLPATASLDAETALAVALGEVEFQSEPVDEPALTYVRGSDGRGYLAWQRTVEYVDDAGPQRDIVFADAQTGKLVARHPQIKYARSLETRDCNGRTRCSNVVSRSSETINTGDGAIDAAHNYAIATYQYYFDYHGRDSIDGSDMTLISQVHYSRNYNNAFWDGARMTYGDGDGTTFIPLSQDADVVGHELTHGVTERSSGLIYSGESGALNEAWSDIFGAMVDREVGATVADIWLIGEDIYTPATPGDALRNMADPAEFGDRDYYPARYTGSSDNGGVHTNSGIANLAFQLLVDGGMHPRGKTSVPVTGIGFADAAAIFYAANVGCLTPGADFAAARNCTALNAADDTQAAAVHLAWDAVGVPSDLPPPPNPPIALSDGVALGGQDAATGNLQQYTLAVAAGETVTCTTSCSNGDADLYLRFGAEADPNPSSSVNACGSYSANSNESCTTGAAPGDDDLYAAVHAYGGYSNLTIQCTSSPPAVGGTCSLGQAGDSCTSGAQCCSGSCGGKPGRRTCR